MSIYEYDEELHERTLVEIGREEGLEEGLEKGITGAVTALRSYGCSDAQILESLVNIYELTQDEADNYVQTGR